MFKPGGTGSLPVYDVELKRKKRMETQNKFPEPDLVAVTEKHPDIDFDKMDAMVDHIIDNRLHVMAAIQYLRGKGLDDLPSCQSVVSLAFSNRGRLLTPSSVEADLEGIAKEMNLPIEDERVLTAWKEGGNRASNRVLREVILPIYYLDEGKRIGRGEDGFLTVFDGEEEA